MAFAYTRRRPSRLPRKMNFRTKKWAELRARVFERDRFTCQGCGWIATEIYRPYDGQATVYGYRDGVFRSMSLDHLVPHSHGGEDTEANLRALCTPCNNKKGNR